MFCFVRGCNNADVYHLRAAFCQALLVDVRDKLLFEQDYAGNIKEKVPPRSSLHIPCWWLPAALCVLQEVMHNTVEPVTPLSSKCWFCLVETFHFNWLYVQ